MFSSVIQVQFDINLLKFILGALAEKEFWEFCWRCFLEMLY